MHCTSLRQPGEKTRPTKLAARSARFERATNGFEVRRSIQLSYERPLASWCRERERSSTRPRAQCQAPRALVRTALDAVSVPATERARLARAVAAQREPDVLAGRARDGFDARVHRAHVDARAAPPEEARRLVDEPHRLAALVLVGERFPLTDAPTSLLAFAARTGERTERVARGRRERLRTASSRARRRRLSGRIRIGVAPAAERRERRDQSEQGEPVRAHEAP